MMTTLITITKDTDSEIYVKSDDNNSDRDDDSEYDDE